MYMMCICICVYHVYIKTSCVADNKGRGLEGIRSGRRGVRNPLLLRETHVV